MDEAVKLSDLGSRLRRRWWVPVALALVGVVIGVLVAGRVAPVYRAEGTLLVGPISGTVTLSTTLRASESLADFNADLARRQVVLETVVDRLGLPTSWEVLREQVSAMVPDQNPRVITLTVRDPDEEQAQQIAQAIVERLLEISPRPSGATSSAFVARQVANLRADIERAENRVDRLGARIAEETSDTRRVELRALRSSWQQIVDQWRNTYVELMRVDPTTDAGGLQLLDDVRLVSSLDRAGVGQGGLGALVGFILGLLLIWFVPGSRRRRSPSPPDEAYVSEPIEPVMSTTVRANGVTPGSSR